MPEAPSTPTEALPSPEDRLVDWDLSCIQCAYNLRTLAYSSSCPECGTGVARSLNNFYLQTCDADWVARLARGATFLCAALACLVLLIVIVLLRELVQQAVGFDSIFIAVFMLIQMGTALAIVVCYLTGVLFITAPQPGAHILERPVCLRRLLRWFTAAAPVLIIGGVLMVFVMIASEDESLMGAIFGVSAAIAIIAGFVAGAISYILTLGYLLRLARRLPNASLARQTRIVLIGSLTSLVMLVAVYAIAIIALFTGNIGGGGAIGILMMIIGTLLAGLALAQVVFTIWMLVLLVFYRQRFRIAIDQARGFAARGTPVQTAAEPVTAS